MRYNSALKMITSKSSHQILPKQKMKWLCYISNNFSAVALFDDAHVETSIPTLHPPTSWQPCSVQDLTPGQAIGSISHFP